MFENLLERIHEKLTIRCDISFVPSSATNWDICINLCVYSTGSLVKIRGNLISLCAAVYLI